MEGNARARRVAVIAHRGASRARRENTLAAFEHARELGADMVELDVRRSADGRLVVHHDARLADGRALVELRRAELPDPVPELADALRACAGMAVNIEIKNAPGEPDHDPTGALARAVAELAARPEHAAQGLLVSSFDAMTLQVVRAVNPALPTAWLTFDTDRAAALARCRADGHVAWHPFDATVDRAALAEAHAAGLAVNVWTVDDPDRMRALIELGVDGLCTNVPDVARAVVDASLGGAA